MGITFGPSRPSPGQISKLYTGRFAAPEEKPATDAAKAEGKESQDKVEISQAGRDAISSSPGIIGFDEMAERVSAWAGSMTKDEFNGLVREQLGEPKQLEVNWVAAVDSDHTIYIKAYMDSFVSQCKEVQNAIEDYYSDAYQEALNNPMGGPLMFIAAKYKCSWSDYYDASIPDNERQWMYDQVRRMLTGQRVSLADPYALAGTGLNQGNSIDRIAEKAATDKIEELIRQAKAEAGIVE